MDILDTNRLAVTCNYVIITPYQSLLLIEHIRQLENTLITDTYLV